MPFCKFLLNYNFCYILFQKCWMSLNWELSYRVMPSLIVFDSKFIVNLLIWNKKQRVWVCSEYARLRFQNAAESGGWLGRWRFLPRQNKQSVHLIQRFYEKRHNGFNLRSTDSAFVLKDTRFRTNTSFLYNLNNNSLLRNKRFAECHLFTANSWAKPD